MPLIHSYWEWNAPNSIARPRMPLAWLRELLPARVPKFLGACEGERPLPGSELGRRSGGKTEIQ